MPDDLRYVLLLFALFVVPRILQRYRLPAAITSFLLGAGVAFSGVELLPHGPTLPLLATFGIASMFLVAGLEVNVAELRRGARVIVEHLALRALVVLAAGFVVAQLLHVGARPAALIALALFTPSTGFILSSLPQLGVGVEEQFWIRAKAIATELLALAILFVVLQSTSAERLTAATGALVVMTFVLPVAFRLFAARIAPVAPRSEFAFLLMLAVVAAYITKALGVYYLVGAFLVGAAAQSFRERLPALSSESLVHAVEAFASLFAPFYFFYAGTHLRPADFPPRALWVGALLLAVCVPLRVMLVLVHRRAAFRQPLRAGLPVALALTPTLVFSLVLAEILRDRFAAAPWLVGALIIYTIGNTLIPGLTLQGRASELDVLQPDALADAGDPDTAHAGPPPGEPVAPPAVTLAQPARRSR
ncbi:cation:proton antiporter [Roseisolibacter sp. H3M3-2]|uniref:cation:proton antiporter n=1 Tax=Roseisolibacter sp. H3M3-2 TaxID=3031323 RepID=UPI0023D9CBFB|nr:cation:proton antiporter [Roseisolibacter sp. H3M3-2]MDF1503944.1 cation:proton antiporter [Roseisolibacter sp. H3M3-2]